MNYSSPIVAEVAGRRHLSWTITENNVGPSDTFQISGLPLFFTLVLFESTVAGPAGTISPEITLDPSEVLNKVVENVTPALYIRNACAVPVFAPRGTLTIKPAPNVGGANTVYTRVTVVEGYP